MAKGDIKTRNKGGRPPIEFGEAVVSLLDDYEGAGTVTQLCEHLGVKNHIFYKWLKEQPTFTEAVMRVRARADDQVENALHRRAIGYDHEVIEERLDKDGCAHPTRKEIHVVPDGGAAMNWLKNRRPETWREKKEVEINANFAERVKEAAALAGVLDDDE